MRALVNFRNLMLWLAPLVLVGCSVGYNGPNDHEVKKLVTQDMYYDVMTQASGVASLIRFTGTESPTEKKEYSEYKYMMKHKKEWMKKAENSLHDVHCNRVSSGKYDCSLKDKKNHSIALQMIRYGKVWKAENIS
ncbi:hypothetical protein A5904_05570 [Acidithiobacillus caldus]|uniref:Lipoprotein n=1 Tax=Acidithiobacillus caldus TaxID=33059 RepID=A0A1E7YZN5_9PROT|nr:hypothetical protein [Acidithiobacillus caldus]AUW32502.1 hypothetical protein A5904_05570 [Acidithiobacillus caldus]OFC61972.1 hypothetical protein BAE30_03295 [Acidithiobacillus caldus]QER44934.1 hypothetical protein F0726_01874 [Acidithiobacillus caldus]